jgi:hypothetical protein
MHPEVEWPNAWEGGRLRGHAAVRSYWARQFESIDARVEPLGFSIEPDGRVTVDVHRVRSGALVAERLVQHAYCVRGGLVASMEVREPQPPAGGDDERPVTEPAPPPAP